MRQYWLVVGSERNWKFAFENGNIWGLKDFRELRSLWTMLRDGDGLLFYVSKPVHGVVGCGYVRTKFVQDKPLWPDEVRKDQLLWPLRFEFDIEHCLPPTLWATSSYSTKDLQLITRMVFQCLPIEEVNAARAGLGLQPAFARDLASRQLLASRDPAALNHSELKSMLCDIGRLQGYLADQEYPLNSTILDAVWRRVQRSVPTYVFEVQIGGDIYHAMAKLKHAFDLWNSNIFLVATLADKAKYQELISGTFHEVQNEMQFIDAGSVGELYAKKVEYREMERDLGIFKQ